MFDIFTIFSENLPSKSQILDLGAGQGQYADYLTQFGHQVTAVDKNFNSTNRNPKITWIEDTIEHWLTLNKSKFDGILLKNILQFFPQAFITESLIPQLDIFLNTKGIIAIESFYKAPEPPFDRQHQSYWTADQLTQLLPNYQIITKEDVVDCHPDMQGQIRKFYSSQVILKK